MYRFSRYIVLIWYLIFTIQLFGQTVDGGYSQVIDQMTLKTPQANMMQRFGDYPVDYATGVVNIDIPVYEISLGDFSLPISISYHASGIKVQDIASSVGLGWVLNAGGIINRQTKGRTDSGIFLYRSKREINSAVVPVNTIFSLEWDLLASGLTGDTESDRYSYSFNGHTGVFRYGVYDGKIYSFPYSAVQINEIANGYSIIDERGNSYYFSEEEKINDYSEGIGYRTSSWYLAKIIIANSQDSIIFEYEEGNIINQRSRYDYLEFVQHQSSNLPVSVVSGGANALHGYLDHSSSSVIQMKPKYLSLIRWRGNVMTFHYEKDRQDYRMNNQSQNRLSSICIENSEGHMLRRVVLYNNSYYGSNSENCRMFLDSISINGIINSSTEREVYSFDYHYPSLLPNYTYTDNKCYEDYWGYYNGRCSDGWVPEEFAISGTRCANRHPDNLGNSTKHGILERIHYPTGGYTEYSYEPNRIWNDSIWGGLRINSVKDFDSSGHLLKQKTYEYSSGMEALPISRDLYRYDANCRYYTLINYCGFSWWEYHNVATSTPIIPLTGDGGSPVYYRTVIEYEGTSTSYTCKTKYSFGDSRVLDIATYHDQFNHADETIPYYNSVYNLEQGNIKPMLTAKEIYDHNGSLVLSESISYQETVLDTLPLGVHFKNRWVLISLVDERPNAPLSMNDFETIYAYYDVYGFQTIMLPSSKTTFYNGKTETVNFLYDPQYRTLEPIAEVIKQAEGEVYKTSYQFPFDFPDSAVYNTMVQRNQLVPICISKEKGNVRISQTKTHYRMYGNMCLPDYVSTAIGDEPLKKRLSYDHTACGRVCLIQKDASDYVYFAWGNELEFPYAKIEGLSDTQLKDILGYDFYDLNPQILTHEYETLRNAGALISLYNYTPLVGLSSMLLPNGTVQTFEYDAMGRLKSSYVNGSLTDEYDFHYKE